MKPTRGFDEHLEEMLATHPKAAREYARLLAELPIQTQLAIIRRRRQVSQRALAKKMRVAQPHIARTERLTHDPRISSVVKAAKAIHCHVVLVPDEQLAHYPMTSRKDLRSMLAADARRRDPNMPKGKLTRIKDTLPLPNQLFPKSRLTKARTQHH